MTYLLIVLYIIFSVIDVQVFKIVLKKSKDHGAITVLFQLFAGISSLIFIPFFPIIWPSNPWPILMLFASAIFLAVADRLNTTVRNGVEASTFSMIKQLKTVAMIILGFTFFGEEFVWLKLLGAALIIAGNLIVFYRPHQKIDKFFLLGVVATIASSCALFFDVNASLNFNWAIYSSAVYIIPALILMTFGRIFPKRLAREAKIHARGIWKILVIGLSSGIAGVASLAAYNTGEKSVVAPLLTLTVLMNLVVGYTILRERKNILRKIIAMILIISGAILIKVIG